MFAARTLPRLAAHRGGGGASRGFKVKDRTRYTSIAHGKTNLAVFYDASGVTADEAAALDPALEAVTGAVCLRRFFTTEEPAAWTALRAGRGFELFLVDSFMPVHMQLLADVAHVMDHRKENGAGAVCVVVPDEHVAAYMQAFPTEPSARGGWDWFVASPGAKGGIAGKGTVPAAVVSTTSSSTATIGRGGSGNKQQSPPPGP